MKEVLRRFRTSLDQFDDTRSVIVTYDKMSCMVTMRQVGNRVVILNGLVGYLIPNKRISILTSNDLVDLKNTLSTICDEKYPMLISPVKDGFNVYVQGDTYYTSRPKLGFKIRLSSISNPIILAIMRATSEEIAMLFRIVKKQKIK